MRIMTKFLLSIILLFFFFNTTFSQPLSGSYSIGGSSADFSSIAAAVNSLVANGINGPVTFNIAAGTYTESVSIPVVNNTSVNNHIIFQSATLDSSDVIITSPSAANTTDNHTIELNGVDHITFQYLTIERSGTQSYSRVINIANASDHIAFYNNRIAGPTTLSSATYRSLIYGANNSESTNIKVENNLFENGSYGIWMLGAGQIFLDQGTEIVNNRFLNQYFCAVRLSYQDAPIVENNIITQSSGANGYGVYAFYCDNDSKMVGNRISVINGKGIYIHNSDGFGGNVGLIANNFIAIGGSGASDGIFISGSTTWNIFYNSVNIYNTNSASNAFSVDGLTTMYLDVKNNLFIASGGGYSYSVSSNTANPITASNFNNLYTTGNYIGNYQATTNIPTLNAFKIASSKENNAISTDPVFFSDDDLHVKSPAMDNKGTAALSVITPVTTDIDGQTRSSSSPDMGADEYKGVDIELLSSYNPVSFCAGNTFSVDLPIKNNATTMFNDAITVSYQFGTLPMVVDTVHSLTIPSNDTVTLSFTSSFDNPGAGNYSLWIAIHHPGDAILTNDTLVLGTVPVLNAPSVNLGQDVAICPDDSVLFQAGTGFSSYLWQNGTTNPSFTAYGSLLGPGNYTVSVMVNDAGGCNAYDSATVKVFVAPQPILSAENDTFCVDRIHEFSCGTFSSYYWFNGAIDSVLVTPLNYFNYGDNLIWVEVIDSNGCKGVDSLECFFVICGSVNETEYLLPAINLFPNPVTDMLTVQFENSSGKTVVAIYNIIGDLIFLAERVNGDNRMEYSIDLSSALPGVYLISISNELGTVQRKIIVK
ncbi:MAG: T9SS type A sorting domain-containing protein [Bacteroidales bacterium]|nr:T9SS type A sorting domain-containing protein [Bacteroidales bacterium]